MRQLLFAWTVESDPAATRAAYERLETGAARRCGCAACLNFDAARPSHFPEGLRRLLESLDIAPHKESSVRLVSPLEGRRHLYTGTYGFCGVLLAGRPFRGFPLTREELDVFERVGPDAHVALRPWAEPPHPWADKSCVRLEFVVVLPWLLGGSTVRN